MRPCRSPDVAACPILMPFEPLGRITQTLFVGLAQSKVDPIWS